MVDYNNLSIDAYFEYLLKSYEGSLVDTESDEADEIAERVYMELHQYDFCHNEY